MHDSLTDPTGNRGSDVLLMFYLKSLRSEKYRDAVPVADDYGKEVVAELRKSRRQDKEMERLRAENARLRESVDDGVGSLQPGD